MLSRENNEKSWHSVFKKYKSIKAVPDYHERQMKYLNNSKKVLLEGAQGCNLDINHSGHYPYVTSRQVSTAQMCADSGISSLRLKEITMVIRPFPIRISNQTNIGQNIYSGDYGCSEEFTWDQIHVGATLGLYLSTVDLNDINNNKDLINSNQNNPELSTVTIKPIRVFDIDIDQLRKNVDINTPTNIYLNFF